MFLHLFKYRAKISIRSKEEVFWVIIFPLLLGTCFYAAFGNIYNFSEMFHTVDVAVVTDNSESSLTFDNIIDEIAKREDNGEPLLNVSHTDMETASELLESGDVNGIIQVIEGTPNLILLEDGLNQSILNEVCNQYIHSMSIINNIANSHPEALSSIINDISTDASFIIEKKLTDGNTNYMTDYFYSLIAMACLMGSMAGCNCAKQMKANLSSLGMRKNLAPVNRFITILADFLATYAIQLLANILLVIYLQYILKVNLGGSIGLIILTVIIGSIIGVSSGILIGSIPNTSDGTKVGITVLFSLGSSFLSGLMVGGIKYQIDKFCPIINKLNPATVITDALYSLNIYDTYEKFGQCMIILVAYGLVFCIISYLMTRRESYASL
ncbi:MAG: ABC transporter permease [Clostridiales bacterium]|nr:ABC transporter permease [Clostridiales bacterium]